MKKEVKKIITILKATPKLKLNIIASIISLIIGIIFLALRSSALGLICTSSCTFFIHEAIMLPAGSGLVQTSSSAKKLQAFYPFIVQLLCSIIIYSSLFFYYTNNSEISTIEMSSSSFFIIFLSYMIAAFQIIETLNCKCFGLGTICALLPNIPFLVMALNHEANYLLDLVFSLAPTNAVIIGYLMILAGSLLSILLANLLYKYPISAHVMKANNKA
ncbi:hypothetical protein [Pseudobutyrivibrio sp.]|uniref:hypothetical protein n=1 Tax=Pseudobutyrivibrio sp. TaxID=2014367 RepID=UPI0025DD3873|nr:hypothetical protein [Pseudobutyrivibrio sp.]